MARDAGRPWQALAQRMGLSYRPVPVPGRAGELNGILRGHRVLVRPDRPALYVEYRFRVEGLRLSTARPRTTPPDGFSTGHAAFDRQFPWRSAAGPARDALRGAAAFHEAALDFARRQRGTWAALDFDGGQFTLTLRRAGALRGLLGGRGGLTPETAEALLPGMLAVVEALEAALRDHALRTAVRHRGNGAG